jgi:membrane-bound lytic murein transglycosylase D
MMKTRMQIFSFALGAIAAVAGASDSLFVVPSVLEDNVTFWKKIYSELSVNEGYLHDAQYPLLIYEKIEVPSDDEALEKERKRIEQALKMIEETPESTWTSTGHRYRSLFEEFGDSSAIHDASSRIRFQQGQKERFIQGLKRSGLYLDTITAIFRSHGIPEYIALLPHVESSFDPHASSKAGAAGLWQFMRSTARTYRMQVTYTVDERRDPVRSTVAAAKYLSRAYKELGSWPLAITAYNHGIQGMKRAIRKTGSKDLAVIIAKYSSPSFRFASSNFYSCFLAAIELSEKHERYFPGVTLLEPVTCRDMQLPKYIRPSVICSYLGIGPTRLAKANPALRPAVFTHDKQLPKGMILHLPMDLSLGRVKTALSEIPDSLQSDLPERPKLYKVRKGDNVSRIAAAFGLSIHDIVLENDLTRSGRIRAGQLLRIPSPSKVRATEKMEMFDTMRTARVALKDTISLAAGTSATEQTGGHGQSEGPDTSPRENAGSLLRNAPTGGVSDAVRDSLIDMASAPAIDGNNESAVLNAKNASRSFDASLYTLDVISASDGATAEITVAVDETMSHYCDWLVTTGKSIRDLNNLRKGAPLRIGQQLRIPLKQRGMLDHFTTARLEYHMAQEEDFYERFMIAAVKPKVVAAGDNLWSLCHEKENEVTPWLLKKYNNKTDFSALLPGDTIWIPIINEKESR